MVTKKKSRKSNKCRRFQAVMQHKSCQTHERVDTHVLLFAPASGSSCSIEGERTQTASIFTLPNYITIMCITA